MADEDPPKAPIVGPRMPPAEHRFEKGKSGNPSGRPKDDPHFRAWCRKLTWEIAGRIMKRIREQPDEISLADMTAAFRAFADRGGFVPADRQIAADVARAKLVLALLNAGAIDADEKQALLGQLQDALKGPKVAA